MRSVKFLMCLFVMLAGLIGSAEEKQKDEDVPTRNEILNYLRKCEEAIVAGKDERGVELTPQHYMAYAMTVHSWLKNQDELELATGIERKWFIKVHEKLDEMWLNGRQSDLDGIDDSSKKNEESGKNFDKSVKEFSELLKAPAQINPVKLYSLKKGIDSKRKKDKTDNKKNDDVETVT